MSKVSISWSQRQKMFREGGYREREIMKNATNIYRGYAGNKDCITFVDKKNGKSAVYLPGRGWVN